jgi:hypothetical protein
MKTSEIRTLLQKYYDGLTSPQEEAAIEDFLINGPVIHELEADRLHFQSILAMRDEDIPVPEDLEDSIRANLNRIQIRPEKSTRRVIYLIMSAAAALLLMVSTYVFVSNQNQTEYVTDPNIAYAESKEALELISKYFNEGTAQLNSLAKIDMAMEPLNKLSSLNKVANGLSKLGKVQDEQ